MKIMFAHKVEYYEGIPIETYSRSLVRELMAMGHEVEEVQKAPFDDVSSYNRADILIDMDCGRDERGQLRWHGENDPIHRRIPCVLILIDSHGYPDMHRRLAKRYTHTLFAVWDKRDLFADRHSVHWFPNFTDDKFFDGMRYPPPSESLYDFGFFGSKHGLNRADKLIEYCNKHNFTYNVRQVLKQGKHRWPATPRAMAQCRFLFNHGQKHDGPNLRVMESMLMDRPLISDQDPRSGMDLLFQPWNHYIPYEAYTYKKLEDGMLWLENNYKKAREIANNAYEHVLNNHTARQRARQLMEVIGD